MCCFLSLPQCCDAGRTFIEEGTGLEAVGHLVLGRDGHHTCPGAPVPPDQDSLKLLLPQSPEVELRLVKGTSMKSHRLV